MIVYPAQQKAQHLRLHAADLFNLHFLIVPQVVHLTMQEPHHLLHKGYHRLLSLKAISKNSLSKKGS